MSALFALFGLSTGFDIETTIQVRYEDTYIEHNEIYEIVAQCHHIPCLVNKTEEYDFL